MTVLTANAEGYADGATVTIDNTGSGDAFSGLIPGSGAITVTSTNPVRGTKSYNFAPATDATSCYLYWLLNPSHQVVDKTYVYFTGRPSVTREFISFTSASAGTVLAGVVLQSGGKLGVTAKGASQATNASVVLALNTLYRIETAVSQGTDSATDTIVVKVYLGESTTEQTTMGCSYTGPMGTASIARVNKGKISTGATTWAPWNMEFDTADSTTVLLGPTPTATAPAVPVLTGTARDSAVDLAWSGSNGGAAITGQVISRSLVGGGAGYAALAAQPAATDLTFTDATAINNTAYYYKIARTNSVGTATSLEIGPLTPVAEPTTMAPIADLITDQVTYSSGTNAYALLNEATLDATSYVVLSSGGTVEILMGPAPNSMLGWILRYAIGVDFGVSSVTVSLLVGDIEVLNETRPAPATPTAYALPALTSAQAALIPAHSTDVRVQLTAV